MRTYRFPGLITRSSNNYGPYQFPEKFLPLMITNALEGKPFPVYGDGGSGAIGCTWKTLPRPSRGPRTGRRGRGLQPRRPRHEEENLSIAHPFSPDGQTETLLTYVKDRPGHDRRYALKCDKNPNANSAGSPPYLSKRVLARRSIGTSRTRNGWPGSAAANTASYYEKYYENRDSSLGAIR